MNQIMKRYKASGLVGLLSISLLLAGTAYAQTPKVNTHDASIPKATKTTKSNLRKAGGAIKTTGRKAGKGLSDNSRNFQKAVGKGARSIGKALTPRKKKSE